MNFSKGVRQCILGVFVWMLAIPGIIYAGDSDLDQDFGTGGMAQAIVGANTNMPAKIAIQSDGKIIQVGSSRNGSSSYGLDITLVRFNTDGTLDTTFDSDGIVTTAIGTSHPTYTDDKGAAVAIQSDGQIVVAGTTRTDEYPTNYQWNWWDVALVRYNTDGSLDTDFGAGGKVVVDLNGTAEGIYDIAFQSDGKIIAAGYTMNGYDNRFLIMRFNTNGTLDTTFGSSGSVIEHMSANTLEDAYSVAVLDDDSIIVAGRGIKADGNHTVSLLKLTASGDLDTSFDGDGKLAVTIGYTSDANSVVVDANGKFVVGGYSKASSSSDPENLILRYNTDGTLDTTFDNDGLVTTSFGSYYSQYIKSLTIQGDDKIIAAGYLYNLNPSKSWHLTLARYNLDGSPDTTFDNDDGKVSTFISSYSGSVSNTVMQSDGKILVGGARMLEIDSIRYNYFTVIRYGAESCSLTMVSSPNEGGTTSPASGTSQVLPGAPQEITASANSGYNFISWSTSGDEAVISDPNAASTTVTLTEDATVTANFCLIQTWYEDNDSDGYGNPAVTVDQCTQPTGYVLDNTDCDDSDTGEHPNQTWYEDQDEDGYSDGTNSNSCERPVDYYLSSELSATSGDNCPAVANSDQTDSDNDGVGNVCDLDDDNDGLADIIEDANQNGLVDAGETDPINPDTDNDGLYDGLEELVLETDPLLTDSDNDGTEDGNEDYDSDGFTNAEELLCDSDPANSDSRCASGQPWLMLLLNE